MTHPAAFYVWRLAPGATPPPVQRLPRRRHPTIGAAITEARRLHGLNPDARFQVVEVVAEIGPGSIAESEAPN